MSAPAGWYPDPENSLALRYFDGVRWTEYTSGPTIPGAASQNRLLYWLVGSIIIVAVLLLGGCGAVLVGASTMSDGGGSASQTATENGMASANAATGLPDGEYFIARAVALYSSDLWSGATAASPVCFFSGTAVAQGRVAAQDGARVMVATNAAHLCAPVASLDATAETVQSVEFTVVGGVAKVTSTVPLRDSPFPYLR